MDNFTPLSASVGGALIGLSAVMLMLFHGKIAGISGVLSGTVFAESGDRMWRIFFLIGLIAGPILYKNVLRFEVAFEMTASWPVLITGGLLVGFGTRLGSGCTSGHGVCGLSRLSPRSFAAVGAFMISGMATVALVRQFVGA